MTTSPGRRGPSTERRVPRVQSTFVRNVRSGDEVTEIDSPNGPWYSVARVEDRVLVVKTSDGLEVEIPYHSSQHILVRR